MRGSVMKRGKSWTYVLYVGRDAAGKKRQKWVGGFPTRREAEAALSQALDRVRTGMWSDPGRITVAAYFGTWLDGIRPSLRPSTVASYEQVLNGWVLPRVGPLRLSELTAPRLRALYGELLTSGRRNGKGALSATSVQYTHRLISHALKDAEALGDERLQQLRDRGAKMDIDQAVAYGLSHLDEFLANRDD